MCILTIGIIIMALAAVVALARFLYWRIPITDHRNNWEN